ncbi:MAG: nicotinamide riboside transporter PnuC [Bacteroides sp.]|nr:nicotinamide riboside transporter PnuC [Bacteroides sp.]MCM1379653.1 nicotinamide riboside transporter PnuC [Bacteroides sp.]MCM1445965.1 nicotinamide riboside transporter PnuC [Prevotella sp.]
MDNFNWIELLGVIIGLLYLYWEFKANAKMWIAGLVMPLISMWIYFSRGIYADFAINIYYFVIAIYGYWNWTRRSSSTARGGQKTLPITHIPLNVGGLCFFAVLILWGIIAWVLINFTDSTIPYVDAFTTALSIVGLWMGSQKYCEQWLAWLIVDVVTVPMQFYKGLIFYPLLYSFYVVMAILGYRNWLKLMQKQ